MRSGVDSAAASAPMGAVIVGAAPRGGLAAAGTTAIAAAAAPTQPAMTGKYRRALVRNIKSAPLDQPIRSTGIIQPLYPARWGENSGKFRPSSHSAGDAKLREARLTHNRVLRASSPATDPGLGLDQWPETAAPTRERHAAISRLPRRLGDCGCLPLDRRGITIRGPLAERRDFDSRVHAPPRVPEVEFSVDRVQKCPPLARKGGESHGVDVSRLF